MAFTFNEEEIRKAITVFHPDGGIFEVRLVENKWNAAGVFNSADRLIDALKAARIRPGANVYMTLNGLNEACYDRKHHDTIIEYASPTVSDNDVTGYEWLLIDVDIAKASEKKISISAATARTCSSRSACRPTGRHSCRTR